MLGDARGLGVAAHHVAGGVLQEQQRHPALLAQLDEVGGLQRALGEDDPVVGDDAHLEAPDAGEAAGDVGAPLGLELAVAGAVDQPGDDLAGVEADAVVCGDDAVDLCGVVVGRLGLGPRQPPRPMVHGALVGRGAQLAQLAVGGALVGRHVVGHARDAGVQSSAAEVVGLDDLPERRLHDGRAA